MIITRDDISFDQQRDGSFTLNTARLQPGEYEITINGMSLLLDDGQRIPVALISTTLRFVIPVK